MKKFFLFSFLFLFIIGLLIYIFQIKNSEDDEMLLFGNIDVRLVDISFRVNGRVSTLIREEGDLVNPGDLIATLDDEPYQDDLKKAKSTYLYALSQFAKDKALFERRKTLSTSGGVSIEDFQNSEYANDSSFALLEAASADLAIAELHLNDTKVFAPTKGVILTRIREPGSMAKAGDPICTLSISDPVWARCFIPEPLLGEVVPGMKAEIYTDSQNGKVYQGQVGFISPVAEFTPKNVETTNLRTDLVYRIRVIVENPDYGLRQGMPVTVKLIPLESS